MGNRQLFLLRLHDGFEHFLLLLLHLERVTERVEQGVVLVLSVAGEGSFNAVSRVTLI